MGKKEGKERERERYFPVGKREKRKNDFYLPLSLSQKRRYFFLKERVISPEKEKMEIEINNFMRYKSASFTFGKCLNLLKGISGSGKSTIFEAISWCLYGGGRSVNPWYCPGAATKVVMKINNLIITREKKSRVSVNNLDKDEVYEDIVAQEFINSYFSTDKSWACCSYIDDNLDNVLIFQTARLRQVILNSIVFLDDDPEKDIDIIRGKINVLKEQLKIDKALYDNEKLAFNTWASKYDTELKYYEEMCICFEKEDVYRENIKTYEKELELLNKKQTLYEYTVAKKKDTEEKLRKFKNINNEDLISLSLLLHRARKRDLIRDNPLFSLDVQINIFQESDILFYQEWENDYNNCNIVKKKYGIVSIEKEREELKDIIERGNPSLFPLIKRKKEIEELLSPFSSFSSLSFSGEEEKLPIYTLEDIGKIREYDTKKKKLNSLIRNIPYKLKEIILIAEYEEYRSLVKTRDELSLQMLSFPHQERECPYTREDYYDAIEKEKQIAELNKYEIEEIHFLDLQYLKEIEKINRKKPLRYTEEDYSLLKRYQELSSLLSVSDVPKINKILEDAQLYFRYKKLIDIYDILEEEDVEEEEYISLYNEYENIKNINETLVCPHCNNNVYLNGNSLSPSVRKVTPKEKKELKEKFEEVKRKYGNTLRRKEAFSSFSEGEEKEKEEVMKTLPSLLSLLYIKKYESKLKGKDLSQLVAPYQEFNWKEKKENVVESIKYYQVYDSLSEKALSYFSQYEKEKNLSDKIKVIEKIGSYPILNKSSLKIRRELDYQRDYQEYLNLKKEYDKIVIPEDAPVSLLVDSLRTQNITPLLLREVRELNDSLSSLAFSLSLFSVIPTYEEAKKEYDRRESYLTYLKLKEEYDSINVPDNVYPISQSDYQKAISKLKELENVKEREKPPYAFQYVKTSVAKSELLKDYEEDLPETKDIEKKHRRLNASLLEKEFLTNELKKYDYESHQLELDKLKAKYEKTKKYLEGIRLFNEYYEREEKEKVYADKYEDTLNILASQKKLLKFTVNYLYNIVDNLVEGINRTIKEILDEVFNEPIEVSLTTFKELKSKKVNPEISLKIRYKGGEFTDIKRLSKGERYRVILAITLAINKRAGMHFLLLDEILPYVEQDMKEKMVNILKKYSGIIITTGHDLVDGEYDNIIEVT